MNTHMWDSPFTGEHLARLAALGATVVPPVGKRLACGDVGMGAMAAPEAVAEACLSALRAAPSGGGGSGGSGGAGAGEELLLPPPSAGGGA
jgi:phosphopantothenoylcysteine synthetase/decarboxylase